MRIIVAGACSTASGSLYWSFHESGYSQVEHIHDLKTIQEQLEHYTKQQEEIIFICGMRDPVARNASAFFQFIDHASAGSIFNNSLLDRPSFVGSQEEITAMSIEKLVTIFLARNYQTVLINWMKIFLKIFNLNVTNLIKSRNELHDQGFTVIDHSNYRVLLYKTERLTSPAPLFDYLERNYNVTPISINRNQTKWYQKIYSRFRAQLEKSFSPETLDAIYSDPVIDFYYSGAEITQFYEQWQYNTNT